MRSVAAAVLDRCLAERLPLAGLLRLAAAPLAERDRALLRSLVLGTTRWLRRIDAVLEAASSRPPARIDPALMAPLRIAVYQLLFLDRVPAHAAVDEAVGEARRRSHRAAAGFVNAVLRKVARAPRLDHWPVAERDPLRHLAIDTSHPDSLVRRWHDRFGGAAARRLLAANNREKPLQLLAFRDRGGPRRLARALAEEGVETRPAELSPLGLTVVAGDPLAGDAFDRGDLYLQDDASQAAALVPPPAAGETVLDAAAAPGGKSFALAAWEPGVRLTLADVSAPRLPPLRANLRRLDRLLPLLVADARRPASRARFDRVVVDLPCSGSGTLRRHPELKWRIGDDELERLSAQGLEMLAGVAAAVRPGGLLVAITCSLEEEENEHVVERFLARRGDFALEPVIAGLPPSMHAGGGEAGLWRVLTDGDHDGFSVHILRRRRGGR
ncbi:MAG: transcription antitermination factor NusB, partial [Thermoanaerobaculia bacterium]